MDTRATPVLQVVPLPAGPSPWPTLDPFLFCVHHHDAYPRGDGRFAPAASLAGRSLGQDFSAKDGWSMYHGDPVPGFPAHPHRGFETVTIVRSGRVDHADSLGAAARYGDGDVQWLTTGRGIVHAEMFPLLSSTQDNPLKLFQIWLNLPRASKMAAPHFTMFWGEDIPRRVLHDDAGRTTELTVIAGAPAGTDAAPLAPPPDSWAARAEADVAIWTLKLAPQVRFTLPAARGQGTQRVLYFFRGGSAWAAGQTVNAPSALVLDASQPVVIENGAVESELLLLQGRPIGEPVVQHGPFVMNTQAEIVQTVNDYRRTQFGGWPWSDAAPVHGADPARFARHPDGREERPRLEQTIAAGSTA